MSVMGKQRFLPCGAFSRSLARPARVKTLLCSCQALQPPLPLPLNRCQHQAGLLTLRRPTPGAGQPCPVDSGRSEFRPLPPGAFAACCRSSGELPCCRCSCAL